MFKKSWHNYSIDQDGEDKSTEPNGVPTPTEDESLKGQLSKVSSASGSRVDSRSSSKINQEDSNDEDDDGPSEEELRILRGIITTDDEEEEEETDEDLLADFNAKYKKRFSVPLSRKETMLSIGGIIFNPGLPLSSDAESSDESQVGPAGGGPEWTEKRISSPDLPQEYWQVQRLVKYIKAGNPTATIIALSALRDFDLKDEVIQQAIKDSGGMEVLLNILDTDESRCKIAALMVIRDVTYNSEISRTVFNMRGLETLVLCLNEPSKEIKLLTAETISNICKIRKARRAMRKSDGINRLVDMLEAENKDWDLARCASLALWSLARSTKNKEAIRKAGAIPLLSKLMLTEHVNVVIPVVGILQECASEQTFREAIRTQGLLNQFVFGLSSDNAELVQFCAKAIYMCAEDEESREIVFHLGAVEPLLRIIQNVELRHNKPLLGAATGAIWKCSSAMFRKGGSSSISSSLDGLPEINTESIVNLLVFLLEEQPEEVLINVSGALYQIVKADLEANAPLLKKAEAIPPLMALLTRNNTDLLVNTTKAMGELARDTEARIEMEKLDGFRLVWSLLKHSSPLVQAGAAWAICPYVENSQDSGDMVRNYVGGLEAIVQLLASRDTDVQASVAYAIGCIARNLENLAIMSDHGAVEYLARLAPTPKPGDNLLRQCLATAIAQCAIWDENSREFGRRKAVGPICAYLTSDDPNVHRAAAKALCSLSSDPRNCVTIHQCGVVSHLINLSGSEDEDLHNSVAGILSNIRRLALRAENVRLL